MEGLCFEIGKHKMKARIKSKTSSKFQGSDN